MEIAAYLESRPHLNAIYIAAPLEELDFINHIKSELKDKYAIYTGTSLEEKLKSSYPSCELMKENFHDIFSTLEQEICFRSHTFLYSAASSWSFNVVQERYTYKLGRDRNEENINLLFRVTEQG